MADDDDDKKILLNNGDTLSPPLLSADSSHHHHQSSLTPAELQKYLAYTLVMCRKFREQPLLSCDAQVFVLDSKRNWDELSSHPVPVHIYFDSTRQTYRLICVDVAKPLINSTITASVVVTKTSKKFAQWLDRHANLVYGLGFLVENELDQFVSKVKELQAQIQTSSNTTNVGATDDRSTSTVTVAQHNLEQDAARPAALNTTDTNTNISSERINVVVDEHHSPQKEADLLKKENEKLKVALSQSSVNVTQWKEKIDTLEKQNRALRDVVFNDSRDLSNTMGASRRALAAASSAESVPRSLSVDSAQREPIGQDSAITNGDAEELIVLAARFKHALEQNKTLSEKVLRLEQENKNYKNLLAKTLRSLSAMRRQSETTYEELLSTEQSLAEECNRFNNNSVV